LHLCINEALAGFSFKSKARLLPRDKTSKSSLAARPEQMRTNRFFRHRASRCFCSLSRFALRHYKNTSRLPTHRPTPQSSPIRRPRRPARLSATEDIASTIFSSVVEVSFNLGSSRITFKTQFAASRATGRRLSAFCFRS
jgi:hypothetical protein